MSSHGDFQLSLESLADFLHPCFPGRVVILGVGNRLRCDDRAGIAFIAQLKEKWCSNTSPENFETKRILVEAGEFPEDWFIRILDLKPEVVIVVDAVDIQADPGSVAILGAEDLPESLCFSTHRLPLKSLLKLWEENGSKTMIIAIQPENLDFGEWLSPRVEMSINNLIKLMPSLTSVNSSSFTQ
ncbi:MAG TPA: hydrogenase maturation protease [Thermodesulfobacteriota bacterium]|nr:hydrogenase maturation protease [Thermodesulfobacteriota bacterium]